MILAKALLEDPARTADAIGVLEAVLAEAPDDGDAAELLSAVLEREGRLEQLAKLLEQRLQRLSLPNDSARFAELSLTLGGVLERTGKSGRSTCRCTKRFSIRGPADAKTLAAIGRTAGGSGQ